VLLLAATSCVEEFWPDLGGKYQDAVVIDGMITSQPGPYLVKVSRSISVGNSGLVPLSGFQIMISDNLGNSETLQEISPGIYSTAANGIQGYPGLKYRIQAVSPAGKVYESEYQELLEPVEVQSLTARFEVKDHEGIHPEEGYQFYLNTIPPDTADRHFIWRLESTYEYESDFKLRFYYAGVVIPVTNADSLQTCWKTEKIRDFFTFSTRGLNNKVIKDFPLIYVNTEDKKLSVRYSLLVRQYTVSESCWEFWNNIREQNSGEGELYARQPFQVKGNIRNPDNPEEPVFGYFVVAGQSDKRIFVDRPMPPVHFYYSFCELSEWDYQNVGTIYLSLPFEWPIFLTTGPSGARAYPPQECIDCRLSGGTIEKPSFWLDQ